MHIHICIEMYIYCNSVYIHTNTSAALIGGLQKAYLKPRCFVLGCVPARPPPRSFWMIGFGLGHLAASKNQGPRSIESPCMKDHGILGHSGAPSLWKLPSEVRHHDLAKNFSITCLAFFWPCFGVQSYVLKRGRERCTSYGLRQLLQTRAYRSTQKKGGAPRTFLQARHMSEASSCERSFTHTPAHHPS